MGPTAKKRASRSLGLLRWNSVECPSWVLKSVIALISAARPLFPRKRKSIRHLAVSRDVPDSDIGWIIRRGAKHRWRHVPAERLGGLEVDNQFVLGRRLHRKVCGLLALEDAIDIAGRAPGLSPKEPAAA
jgi:hypothetical protein